MTVRLLQSLQGHQSDVTCCEFYGRSSLYTGSSDKTVRVWKWNQGEGFREDVNSPFLGHKYGVTCVRVSKKGDLLASSSVDGTTILWCVRTGAKHQVLVQDTGEPVRSCAFSPDGAVLVTSADSGALCVWTTNCYTLTRILRYHSDAVCSVCFSPDSQLLLSGCTLGNIRITLNYWPETSETGEGSTADEALYNLDAAHDLGVLAVDISTRIITGNNSRNTIYTLVSCGTDHLIKIWHIIAKMPEKGSVKSQLDIAVELINTVLAHGSTVTSVRFSIGGSMLASASLDKSVKLWTTQNQMNCKATLTDHTRYVNCVSFNSDGMIMSSGSNDRFILIWDVMGTLTLDSDITKPHTILTNLTLNMNLPDKYLCPITHELMIDPVICEDGFVYERQAIESWFESGNVRSPMTNIDITSTVFKPTPELKEEIKQFADMNGYTL